MKRASFMKNSPLSGGMKPRNRGFVSMRIHDGSFRASILHERKETMYLIERTSLRMQRMKLT